MRFILLQEAENPKGCLGKFCGFLPKLERLGSQRLAKQDPKRVSDLPLISTTRLDILGICLECYQGVNRDALHSASRSRKPYRLPWQILWIPSKA